MNITGTLKKIKQLRNELKRKIKIRKENFFVIIPKESTIEDFKKEQDNETEFVDFDKISKNIKEISNEITNLRVKIIKTNINTFVDVDGVSITLSRLKLRIDDIRSELAQIEGINEENYYEFRHRITTSEEEEKQVAQLTDLKIEKLIKKLEEEKIKLENLLEISNANTQLIE